jgi:hypothetical protein
MLRLVQIGSGLPFSYPVDPTSTFEPGMIGQLKVIGNEIVCGVSDGSAPIGIIDEINTAAFTAPVVDEVVDVPVVGVSDGYGNYVVAMAAKQELRFANIVRSSFIADIEGITLNEINGVITVSEGTAINKDLDGDGIPDTVRVIVNYIYRIPNIPGDNTTVGNGRITIWFQRGIFETDMYDTKQRYVVNATLFVNSEGKLTTRQETPQHPGVALCTGPPTAINNTIEFMWL